MLDSVATATSKQVIRLIAPLSKAYVHAFSWLGSKRETSELRRLKLDDLLGGICHCSAGKDRLAFAAGAAAYFGGRDCIKWASRVATSWRRFALRKAS